MAIETLPGPSIPITTPFRPRLGFLTATPIIATATVCLVLIIAPAVMAPFIAPHDPMLLAPAQRLKPSSAQFLLGTDAYGRDVLSRTIYGGRISLLIGLRAAGFSISLCLALRLVFRFFRWGVAVCGPVSGSFGRVTRGMLGWMDGVMAIPATLLGFPVVSLGGGSLWTVL